MARIPTSRVDKLLSSMGYGSRKDMARMAKEGCITLDGASLLDFTRRILVTPDLPSRMQIDGAALDPLPGMVILMNKPLGMTCSRKEHGSLVYDILPERWRRRDPAISTTADWTNRLHQRDFVAALTATGLRPVIDRSFDLAQLTDAFRHQESNRYFGKICVTI